MSLCEYVVVRYVQDEIRDEAINIGIILRDSTSGSIYTKFYKSMNQLLIRKPDANIDLISDYLESIETIKSSDKEYLKSVSENFSHQIQFSEVMGTKCSDPEDQVKKLYKRFVSLEEIPQVNIIDKFKSIEPNRYKNKSFEDIFEIGIDRSPSEIAKNGHYQKFLKNTESIRYMMSCYNDLKNKSEVKEYTIPSKERISTVKTRKRSIKSKRSS